MPTSIVVPYARAIDDPLTAHHVTFALVCVLACVTNILIAVAYPAVAEVLYNLG